jgi:hypothetical protein
MILERRNNFSISIEVDFVFSLEWTIFCDLSKLLLADFKVSLDNLLFLAL